MLQAEELTLDLLTFRVAGHVCAIRAAEVRELLLYPELVQSVVQPRLLDGFLNLRGTAVPILALHRLVGLAAPEPDLYTPIVVVSNDGPLLGLRVDRLDDLIALRTDAIQPYPGSDSFRDCADGQFQLGSADAVLLSTRRLLLAEERQCLAEWQARTQARLQQVESPPEP